MLLTRKEDENDHPFEGTAQEAAQGKRQYPVEKAGRRRRRDRAAALQRQTVNPQASRRNTRRGGDENRTRDISLLRERPSFAARRKKAKARQGDHSIKVPLDLPSRPKGPAPLDSPARAGGRRTRVSVDGNSLLNPLPRKIPAPHCNICPPVV